MPKPRRGSNAKKIPILARYLSQLQQDTGQSVMDNAEQ